jgi:hypothetical protein
MIEYNIKINSHSYTIIMHIENFKLKYNQTIVTWKWLHQHPCKNLAAHCGAGMASYHVLLFFNLSSLQKEFTV